MLCWPTTPQTKSYRKDPELNRMWEIFEHAWGNPQDEGNAHALSQLAIADGEPPNTDSGPSEPELEPDAIDAGENESLTAYPSPSDHDFSDGMEDKVMEIEGPDDSSVTTTQPELSDDQECPDGMSPEEWNAFRTKYPRLAQPNPDGTQPDSMSPAAPSPSPSSAVPPADTMLPPAPPSPSTIERKKALMARLAELRWGDSKPQK